MSQMSRLPEGEGVWISKFKCDIPKSPSKIDSFWVVNFHLEVGRGGLTPPKSKMSRDFNFERSLTVYHKALVRGIIGKSFARAQEWIALNLALILQGTLLMKPCARHTALFATVINSCWIIQPRGVVRGFRPSGDKMLASIRKCCDLGLMPLIRPCASLKHSVTVAGACAMFLTARIVF